LKVKFRFNKSTGQVEYDVDDVGESGLSIADHNRIHDQAAAVFAQLLFRGARISEIDPSQLEPDTPAAEQDKSPADETAREDNRERTAE
jgi:hypothetical protein